MELFARLAPYLSRYAAIRESFPALPFGPNSTEEERRQALEDSGLDEEMIQVNLMAANMIYEAPAEDWPKGSQPGDPISPLALTVALFDYCRENPIEAPILTAIFRRRWEPAHVRVTRGEEEQEETVQGDTVTIRRGRPRLGEYDEMFRLMEEEGLPFEEAFDRAIPDRPDVPRSTLREQAKGNIKYRKRQARGEKKD